MVSFKNMSAHDKDKLFRSITGLVFILFMVVIFGSYISANMDDSGDDVIPVITADGSPIKIRPEDEGGMDIPFRETEIYGSVEGSGDGTESSRLKKEGASSDIDFQEETMSGTPGSRDIDDLISSLSKDKVVKKEPVATKKTKAPGSAFKTHRVQLGSFRTEKEATSAWNNTFTKKHAGALTGLSLHIDKAITSKGTFYRVQTNAIPKTKATAICKAIGDCLVVSK